MSAKPEEPEKTEKPFQIWCDGSYGLEYQISGWGAVIVRPDGCKEEYSGVIPECTNSTEAELWSILESLKKLPNRASAEVRCDCISAINLVQTTLDSRCNQEQTPASSLMAFMKSRPEMVQHICNVVHYLSSVRLMWVKGHSDDKCNCDAHTLAITAMREEWQRRQEKALILRRKHWTTYIVPIAVILDHSGYVRQKGEVRRITKRLCEDGLMDATNPYDPDNLPTMPTAAQIAQIARKLHLELRGGLVAA